MTYGTAFPWGVRKLKKSSDSALAWLSLPLDHFVQPIATLSSVETGSDAWTDDERFSPGEGRL
jgi:hypothetical protein